MVAEAIAQDVRHAVRVLRRDPMFTVTALVTLALGIGLTTTIFSVAYGVLWRPLPYPDPDRLVVVTSTQQTERGPRTFSTWAPVSYEGLRAQATSVEHLAAYAANDVTLTGRGEPLQVQALTVSPNFFTTLGSTVAHGRGFLSGAAQADDDRSVVLSDRVWRTTLQADPALVGQSITIDGIARTVVGVLPSDFSFRPVISNLGALPEPDLYLADRWTDDTDGGAFLFLLGRLKSDTARARAEAELTALANDPAIAAADAMAPEGRITAGAERIVHVTGLREHGTRASRTLLGVLLGAVGFVLLIACANVANLQLARLTARRGELSVRLALGAGRPRIVRQLLTEATVLSLLGAALGIALAWTALDATLPFVPAALLPRVGGIVIDGWVLAFTLALTVLSTLLTGLVPAARISATAFGEGLAQHAGSGRTTGDRQGEQLRTLLVAAQIAVTLVLLIGAGLLVHSFVRLTSVSPGFDTGGREGVVQTVRVTLPPHLYAASEGMHAFGRTVLERIQALPGVTSASLINSAPFGRMFLQYELLVEGDPKTGLQAGTPKIEPGYFATMGIPIVAGRDFTASDTAESHKVAIVSERVVRSAFPGGPGEALGRRVRSADDSEWRTVVGVVADIRQMGLDRDVQPMLYVPYQQERDLLPLRFVSFVARTGTPTRVVEGMRAEVRRAAPDLPIASTATMEEAVMASVAQPRFRMVLLVLFATAALLIATGGLYGLMAFAVAQRRREIGLRMALGADRGEIIRLVLARVLRVIVIGLVVGLVGAVLLTRVLQRFLFGVTPTDPMAFVAVTLLLVVAGLVAAWVPTRQATRIDPWDALRSE